MNLFPFFRSSLESISKNSWPPNNPTGCTLLKTRASCPHPTLLGARTSSPQHLNTWLTALRPSTPPSLCKQTKPCGVMSIPPKNAAGEVSLPVLRSEGGVRKHCAYQHPQPSYPQL